MTTVAIYEPLGKSNLYTFFETFALYDHWWPWPEFEFLCQKCFFCAQELKNTLFENLHLMTFGDPDLILISHDAKNAFSMHRSSKIDFFKICTWWPLVTLTWLWPPMMLKVLFLCILAQKYPFWKFALDDLRWPWLHWPTCVQCTWVYGIGYASVRVCLSVCLSEVIKSEMGDAFEL